MPTDHHHAGPETSVPVNPAEQSPDTKNSILDRRHFFGAAALAGLAVAGGCASNAAYINTPGAAATSPPLDAVNVHAFGARGDGKTDDTAAIQMALDAAGRQNGNVVSLPPGHYVLRDSLHVPQNVTLQGCFRAPPRSTVIHDKQGGSCLLALAGKGQPDGKPLISLATNGTLYGLSIFYPEQRCPDVPVEYPWTVRQLGDNASLVNVLITNPWQAVDFGTVTGGRHYIDGLYAQPLKTGLFIDRCADVGRVQNVHFWPFWSTDPNVMAYTSKSATAFRIGRADWEYMFNCFSIFYSVGYHFVRTANGTPNVLLTQCGSDEGAADTQSVSVLVDGVQEHAGISFVNGQFMGAPSVHTGNNCAGPVKFTNCGFWGGPLTDTMALLDGTGHTTFIGCHFNSWGQHDRNASAIRLGHGGLTVDGCEFKDAGKRQMSLESAAEAAIILGNRFHGPARISNRMGQRAQIIANATS